MKKLFLSLAILMSVSFSTINAQNGPRKGDHSKNKISKELSLSEEQKTKMESASLEFRSKMKDLRSQSDLTKDQKTAKMKEIKEQHEAVVNNILTPEQQTKMKDLRAKKDDSDKFRKDRRNMTMHKGNNRHHRGGLDKELNLTDDQKAKIKVLNDEYRSQSRELAQKHREELNKIYTPEQQEKIKEYRKDSRKDNKAPFRDRKRMDRNLDQASKDKLKELRNNFEKEKKAVELSRIAPDAQKQKIKELREGYMKEKRQVIENAKKIEKPV
ncbi:MAG: Spy/CpxP family protein refolding chaperone [Dysgonomonas sp.]|nr:Spy/CpxP family protein refolding chaperone [Dysgonomonas sp.]